MIQRNEKRAEIRGFRKANGFVDRERVIVFPDDRGVKRDKERHVFVLMLAIWSRLPRNSR